jgi:nucleoside-diphosphate-sugar epimerase
VRIAVTGASGFVGRHLLHAAAETGVAVAAVVRSPEASAAVRAAGAEPFYAPELRSDALQAAFAGAHAVVHLAHIGSERPGSTYQAVNVEGTRAAAAAAVAAGVPRMVMFSGLGVARYGLAPRSTNPYFLSKLQAEQELFTAGLEAVVFRPSYILGAGEGFVPHLLAQARGGGIELPGEGAYRMQPVAVEDAAAAILAAAGRDADERLFFPQRPRHRVFDLVGPEPVSVHAFVARVTARAAPAAASGPFAVRSVRVAEADAAAAAGGWHGLPADELDCLLCDEVADPGPLAALLGRPLRPLEEALARAVASALAARG